MVSASFTITIEEFTYFPFSSNVNPWIKPVAGGGGEEKICPIASIHFYTFHPPKNILPHLPTQKLFCLSPFPLQYLVWPLKWTHHTKRLTNACTW